MEVGQELLGLVFDTGLSLTPLMGHLFRVLVKSLECPCDLSLHDKLCLSYIDDAESQQSCDSRQVF